MQDAQPLSSRKTRLLGIAAYLLVAVAILVERRPDAVHNPQLWAEDATVWFAGAYDGGIPTLFEPFAGYLAVLPRLVGLLGAWAGLGEAPRLFTAVSLLLQLAPAVLILSPRFEGVIPRLWLRALLGLVYLLVPCAEAHANLANAQWHLALLMCMVVLARPPRGLAGRVLDVAVVAVGGLTAAVILVLAPVAVVRWAISRQRWHGGLAAIAAATASLQFATLVTHLASRSGAPLGAGVRPLVRILTDRVAIPTLVGEQNPDLFSTHWPHGLLLACLVSAALLAAAGWALLRGPGELRLLVVFGGLVLGVSLLSPLVVATGEQWPTLDAGDYGTRYFLIPVTTVAVLLVWAVSRLPRTPRAAVAAALATTFLVGVAFQPRYPAFIDLHPAAEAAALESAPRGAAVDLPVNPAGWHVVLQRR